MPIKGLGQDWNVLEPCFGFSVTGPGVDLAGANLESYGQADPGGRRAGPTAGSPVRSASPTAASPSPSRPRC